MKVSDLGKVVKTYRVSMAKGDDILSGLTEFAEKYKIRNGYFTALGAVDQGLFGWTEIGRAANGQNLQRKIELNEEAEIVSLMGTITLNAQGQGVVHAHGSVALSDGTVKGGQVARTSGYRRADRRDGAGGTVLGRAVRRSPCDARAYA